MARLNKWELQHLKNLSALDREIERIFEAAIKEAARIGATIGDFNPDRLFSFSDYPITRKRIEKLLSGLKSGLSAVIVNGINSAWTLSNNKNNELARQVFGDNVGKLSQAQYRHYFSTNDEARRAFIERKTGGLNLSDRVWRYTEQFKEEIELGLDVGIRNGVPAEEMTKELRQYLKHPDKLFRRVRDEHGILRLSKRAAAFHPGQGVYRSSFKNARRLAATETNIAYHTADYTRWQELDFVVGIRVVLSNNHTLNGQAFHDICDELSAPLGAENTSGKGCYPKTFKFTGWHPHCRCHAVSILKTEEEMAADNELILKGEKPNASSENMNVALPDCFLKWLNDNSQRMKNARTMPYFITDNEGLMDGDFLDRAVTKTRSKALTMGDEVQGLAEGVARHFGAVCTPINFKGEASIKRKVLSERQDTKEPTFSPDRLKDTVRTTIVADRSKIADIIETLQGEECFMRLKRQNTPMGYTGNIINITTSGGLTAEIQINTARMIYAKESPDVAKSIIGDKLWNMIHRETGLDGGLGHKFYEQWRVLDPDSQEAKDILKKSREYYRHFTS